MSTPHYFCNTEDDLLALGITLAPTFKPGQLVFLQGHLGAGKTTLMRGVLRGFGYQGVIKSPTFTLVESYTLPLVNIYHFDLYRINSADELEAIGFRDYLQHDSICFIEWPEKAADYLPAADITITITVEKNGRQVTVNSLN